MVICGHVLHDSGSNRLHIMMIISLVAVFQNSLKVYNMKTTYYISIFVAVHRPSFFCSGSIKFFKLKVTRSRDPEVLNVSSMEELTSSF